MSKRKLLEPTIDVVFQALFGEVGSENFTKRFLEQTLDEKINSINLSKNPVHRRQSIKDKMGVLDVVAEINNKETVNIEMQMSEQQEIAERLLYYWARKYTHQLKKSQNYDHLYRTIAILITNFEIKRLKELAMHTKWKIIEEKERKVVLTNALEIHIINLDKVKENDDLNNELIDWLSFIKEPNSERVKRKMVDNKELKEAHDKLEEITDDETLYRISEWKKDAIYTENMLKSQGKRDGIIEGKREGRKEKQIEIAKRMKKAGAKDKYIMDMTDLSLDEIQKLKIDESE